MMTIEQHIAKAEEFIRIAERDALTDQRKADSLLADAHTNLARLKFETGLGS